MVTTIVETLIVIFSLITVFICLSSLSPVVIGKVWLVIVVLILIAMSLSPLFVKKIKDLNLRSKKEED